jgi:hypothetical protein
MARGKEIPEVVHWIIVRLHTTMSAEEISMYTEVSVRKVNGIITYFKETGDVKPSHCSKPQLHRMLCDYDIEVRNTPFYCLNHYLMEYSICL